MGKRSSSKIKSHQASTPSSPAAVVESMKEQVNPTKVKAINEVQKSASKPLNVFQHSTPKPAHPKAAPSPQNPGKKNHGSNAGKPHHTVSQKSETPKNTKPESVKVETVSKATPQPAQAPKAAVDASSSTPADQPKLSKNQKKKAKRLANAGKEPQQQPPAKKVKVDTDAVVGKPTESAKTIAKTPVENKKTEGAKPTPKKADAAKQVEAMNVDSASDDDSYESGESESGEFDEQAMDDLTINMGQIEEIQNERAVEYQVMSQQLHAKYSPMFAKACAERKVITDKISMFWIMVLTSHPTTGSMIVEEDEMLLSKMKNLDVQHLSVKAGSKSIAGSGYVLTFEFTENEFLSKNEIKVEVKMAESGSADIKVHPIAWREGKNFTVLAAKGNKPEEQAEYDGFFTYFNHPEHADAESFFDEIAHDINLNANELYIESMLGDSSSNEGIDSDDDDMPGMLVDDEAIESGESEDDDNESMEE